MDYFLQSPPWADFQRALGRTVHEQSGPGLELPGHRGERTPPGKLLYAPYGPVAESLDAFDAALAALAGLARRCGAVFVRIEPVTAGFGAADAGAVLRSRGLQPAPATSSPSSAGSWTWTGTSRTSWRT